MTARVYRGDEWHPVSRDAADVIALGAERVIDDGRRAYEVDPATVRDLARTVVFLHDGAPPSTTTCRTTHHRGCACWESQRDTALSSLSDEVMQRRAERDTAMRERDALRSLRAMDADRVAALESALCASLARWRAARGRYTPFPHCDVCGVRLAADGTETHDAECAVGRDLRVLGGGAT